MELRNFAAHEVRASRSDKGNQLSGYAAVYNTLSNPIPGQSGTFRERILPGAFDEVLASKPDVVMTLNHNMNLVLGRTASGTLRLTKDNKGLRFDVTLPNTSYAHDAYESVKRGDLNGCSFAFADVDDAWGEEDEPPYSLGPGVRGYMGKAQRFLVRTIKTFRRLMDVSVVTTPCYPGTQINARNLVAAEVRSRVEKFERWASATLDQRLDMFCEARGLVRADFAVDAKGGFVWIGPNPFDEARRRRRMLLNSALI